MKVTLVTDHHSLSVGQVLEALEQAGAIAFAEFEARETS